MEMVTGTENLSEVNYPLYEDSLQMSSLNDWLQNGRNTISNEHVSGGERKQIALARAIYSKPEILLLDEVTAGMDSELAESILHNLRSCSKFKLVLLATHDSIVESDFSQIIQL
jgi:ABC-type transport system involved in cytochrome bd biosynthesis fused ATPase/permease subunit